MRSLLLLALSLALATPVHAADEPALGGVPSGTRVRLVLEGRPGTLNGRFVYAGPDSLHVKLRGGRVLDTPILAVASLSFVDGRQPSPRKANLLGIGLGAAGGAVLGVVAGNGFGEGGGEGGGGGGGGDREGPRVVSAVAAASPTGSKTSAEYRAVIGAIVGGLAGGLLGSLTGLGMSEEHWTTVTPGAATSSRVPASAAPPLFAVRIPLPHRAHR